MSREKKKFMWKRMTALAAAVLIGTTALAGCAPKGIEAAESTEPASQSSSNTGTDTAASGNTGTENLLDPANPTKVTFYSYSLNYPTMKAGMEHLIQEFNDTVGKEKGVVVEGVPDDMTKFKTDIQAGNQVDIIQHTFGTLDASRGALGIKAYEDVFPEEELQEHFQGISENALALGKIDDKTYGLAFTFSTPILYINGKLFEDAGLDPDAPPKSWEEMLTMGKTIKEKTGKDGFGLAADNGWVTEGIVYSSGSDMINADRSKAVFATDNTVNAFEMWKQFYTEGCGAKGTDNDLMQQFMAGNVAMHIQSTSVLSGFASAAKAGGWELYGAAMPGFDGNEAVPVNSGSCLAVRPDSDEKAQAVWEFIKFATGKRGYTIITSEIGYLPLRTELADDPEYLKDFVDQYPLLRVNLEQLKKIRPVTIWPGDIANEAFTIFRDATVEALTTDADVKTVLEKAQNDIDQLLE